MAIVDFAFYSTTFMGREANETEFPALEARAEDIICAMTKWQVSEATVASLPPFTQTLVKKAICAQVDYFAVNGLDSVAGSDGRGFTVGKVSISGKSGSEVVRKGALSGNISPLAIAYLEQTGLMAPQVATAPEPPITGWWY